RAPGASGNEQSRRTTHRPYAKSGSEITHLAASVSAKAASLLKKLCGRGHEWAIAWRQTRGDALSAYPPETALTFQRIANNAGSYFADPFVIARAGRHYLFAEEYFYDSDRGVI